MQKEEERAVVFVGNCQMRKLSEYAVLSNRKKVHFISIFDDWTAFTWAGILGECGCFIYQRVHQNDEKKWLGTDALLSLLDASCVRIQLPSLIFEGYFPDIITHSAFSLLPSPKLFFTSVAKETLELYQAGKTSPEAKTLKTIETELLKEPVSTKFILENCENSFQKLRQRESNNKVDIVVSNYIEENYKTTKLFETTMHPTGPLLYFVMSEIERKFSLGIFDLSLPYPTNPFRCNGSMPILPCVVSALELTFSDTDGNLPGGSAVPLMVFVETIIEKTLETLQGRIST